MCVVVVWLSGDLLCSWLRVKKKRVLGLVPLFFFSWNSCGCVIDCFFSNQNSFPSLSFHHIHIFTTNALTIHHQWVTYNRVRQTLMPRWSCSACLMLGRHAFSSASWTTALSPIPLRFAFFCFFHMHTHVRHDLCVTKHQTIGASYGEKHITVDGKEVVIGLWDTAGSERYESMTRMYYRGANVALVCYGLWNTLTTSDDVLNDNSHFNHHFFQRSLDNTITKDLTQAISLEKVKKWTEELHTNERDCIVFIVGTKRLFLELILTNKTAPLFLRPLF